MEELKWEMLTEVLGQAEAELLKLYFQAHEIEVELFEEAITSTIATVTFGRVQVFVEKKNATQARELLEEYESKIGEL